MKNRNMFILMISVLLIVILISSTAALILSGITDDPIDICVVVDDSSSVRWASFTAGLEQAAKDQNVKLNIISTTKNTPIAQEYTLVNNAIDNGAEGVILQPITSMGSENFISGISSKAVLVMVDNDVDMEIDVEGKSACIEPDNIEVGKALANEVMLSFGSELSEHTIGIIAGNEGQNSTKDKHAGFEENLASSGANIVWVDYSINAVGDRIKYRQNNEYADILVAFDNAGLEAACEYAQKQGEELTIFGVGNSIKNVSYLDDGLINSMVVPNEYYMGYQAVTAIVKRLDNRLTPMENETISFRIIKRESLFDETNQRLLFPVVE